MNYKSAVTRREHFNSAHRLHNTTWSHERNKSVFGKCNNPNFHGHNYELEVKVIGSINEDTGYVIDTKDLSDLIKMHILEKFDHKNLNLDVEEFKDRELLDLNTPWGKPSDQILSAKLEKEEIYFIPRHGRGHKINPTNINFRGNIDAMKQLGVTDIISVSAVGSLKEDLPPGKFVIVDQFIDRTFDRKKTFFDEDIVAHVSMAHPTSNGLMNACEEAIKRIVSKKNSNFKNFQVGYIAINKSGETGSYSIHDGFSMTKFENNLNKIYKSNYYSN